MPQIKRALISVSDKTGIVEFAQSLHAAGVEILSTGGTAKLLLDAQVPATMVSDYTGFPEMMDGRIKTLHPKIHGAILGRRDVDSHMQAMQDHDIKPIDLVAINLYPFEATVAQPDCALEDAVENIDIGGPAMIRSAAKNFKDVAVVVNPEDYATVLREMKDNGGDLLPDTRFRLSRDAYAATARYDALIADYFSKQQNGASAFSPVFQYPFAKIQDLRYGENPHQSAAYYKDSRALPSDIVSARQIQGKELSYNNILDMNAAWELVTEFKTCAAVVVKHSNPCGAALDADQLQAFVKARETDPVSAFGGVIGLNQSVSPETAEEILKNFVEVVVAPGFDPRALELFAAKKNVRVMEMPCVPENKESTSFEMKKVSGGLLVQSSDSKIYNSEDLKTATKREPTSEEMESLRFAWTVAKHVKSNAIVYAKGYEIVGVGAGQMSRVDSAKIAISKAQQPVAGSVMASDAFFPFRDSIDAAAENGITAVIQPGGSIRDEEVIQAADENGMAMVFTGMRHFRH